GGCQRLAAIPHETEIGPVARLFGEAFGILDRSRNPNKLSGKVAAAAGTAFCADAGQFLDDDGAVGKLAGFLIRGKTGGIDVDMMEFRKSRLAVVHVVGSYRRRQRPIAGNPWASSVRLCQCTWQLPVLLPPGRSRSW